jgi:hypothetical protein
MRIASVLILLATLQAQAQDTGVVAGRVLYPSGEPLAGVQLELLHYDYSSQVSLGGWSDRPKLSGLDTGPPAPGWFPPRPLPSGGQTNDRGEYRFINIPPGKYFVRVPSPHTDPVQWFRPAELSPIGARLYPGVEGLTKAEQIDVRAGQELRLNDIVVARTTLQPIRATVAGNAVRPFLFLHGGPAPDEPPYTQGLVNGVPVVRPDEPGNYWLCATDACTEIVYTGSAMNVALTPQPRRAFLTGRVLLEGQEPMPVADVAIGAVGIGGGANFGATSGPDGSFKSRTPVKDGPLVLRYLRIPDGHYLSSVRQGKRNALTEGLLISGEDTNLDVRLVKSSSVVRGRVLGGNSTVVLIPQGPLALRQDKESTHHVATTNPDGTFEIRNVIPGTYRAYAFAKIQEGSHRDAAAFKSFEKLGTPVEIGRDGNVSIELKQLP